MMGGRGSGNRQRFDSKTLAEDCLKIDIRHLSKEGCLKPGQRYLKWQNGCSIAIKTERDAFVLQYAVTHDTQLETVDIKIPLSWTSCTYGGKRPWFICPGEGCGRRVAKLYLKDRYFRCRHCHDLAYSSQREGKEKRLMYRSQRICRRLGANSCFDLCLKPKPKGMHQSTYDELSLKAKELDRESLIAAAKKFGNF
jgi:hypothetical protein